MTLKTIIVDDEAPSRRRIKKLLSRESGFELVGVAESGTQAIKLIDHLQPDLLFLDIQLKDMTGLEVLQKVACTKSAIIFITAYNEYAIEAFERNAIDYLLKPYKDSRFSEAIRRTKNRIFNTDTIPLSQLLGQLTSLSPTPNKIKVQEGKTIHLIDYHRLLFIIADGYYSTFNFQGGHSKTIRIPLKKLEKIFPEHFARVSRSMIINLQKVLSYKSLKKTVDIEVAGGHRFSFTKNKNLDQVIQYLEAII